MSSFSSEGSSNDFGLPSRGDSGASDMCNVEFALPLENNNSSQNIETTLKRICEPYKDSSRDVHTLKEFARMNITTGNSNIEKWKKNGQTVYIWSHQTVKACGWSMKTIRLSSRKSISLFIYNSSRYTCRKRSLAVNNLHKTTFLSGKSLSYR